MGVKRVRLSGGDAEGRRRWKRRLQGGGGSRPHLLHPSQNRQPTPPLPERVRRVGSAPGSCRAPPRPACTPPPSVRSTAAGTPRPCPPPRPAAPAGWEAAGLAQERRLHQPRPSWHRSQAGTCRAGRHEPARQGRTWERHSGDTGIPGTTAQGPPGTVVQAVTPHKQLPGPILAPQHFNPSMPQVPEPTTPSLTR